MTRLTLLRRLFMTSLAVVAATAAVGAGPADESLDRARDALQRGEHDRALDIAARAIEADPANPKCYETRAAVHDARRDYAKAVADYTKVIELSQNAIGAYQRRGEDFFRLGRFKESVADFDKVIEIDPERRLHHWQRGISLYYAGEFERGAEQFERHREVNPDDVENAAWHYLCVARTLGVEKAKAGLIPVAGDERVPMAQVHAMFAGKTTPEDVLEAAKNGAPAEPRVRGQLFYAHLYIGLFLEADGRTDKAREHILLASGKYSQDHYMGDVARVHARVLDVDRESKDALKDESDKETAGKPAR